MENQDLSARLQVSSSVDSYCSTVTNSESSHEIKAIQDEPSSFLAKPCANSGSSHEIKAIQDELSSFLAKPCVNSGSSHEIKAIQDVPSDSLHLPSTQIINSNSTYEITRPTGRNFKKSMGRVYRKDHQLMLRQMKSLPPQEIFNNEIVENFYHGSVFTIDKKNPEGK
jgi:hypothetical protein